MATKKEIARGIAAEVGVSQALAARVVQRLFDGITETLIREKRIEVRNFGVFEVRLRAPRKARNPQTNESLSVPMRAAVAFRPGKEMAERIALLPVDQVVGGERASETGH